VATLGELALRRVHAGTARPSRAFYIAGENLTSQLVSASAEFDPHSGGSAMQIQVRDSLEGLEDAPVTLGVGYGGRMVRYFVGRLQEPSSLASGKATAYGPFKLMADQSFGSATSYPGGISIGYFFRDLGQRAALGNGVLEVRGGESYTLDKLDFTEETRLAEAAKKVADAANFVFFDRPDYKRAAMPVPRPGTSGLSEALYSEASYPKDGFTTQETKEGHYSKVVVFRRDDEGNYLVRAVAPVPNRGLFTPPANRIFYVPEFPGNQAAAEQEAYEVAHRLAFGELEFSLSNIWINPELELYDSITVERTERRAKRTFDKRPSAALRAGKWLVTYRCLIDGPLTLKVSKTEHYMSLSGGAIKIAERKLSDPIRLGRAITPGIVTVRPTIVPGLRPYNGLKPRPGLKPYTSTQI